MAVPDDPSHGYEACAEAFMAVRSLSGRTVVQQWAAGLPRGGSVVDVGSGHGEPLTSALIDAGLAVSAIDASPTLVAAFRQRFPDVDVVCEPVETSRLFDRTFDAALAVGLIFLLPEDAQRDLIRRLARVLEPGGRLLFSAPHQRCSWTDVLTGQVSRSLGRDAYERVLVQSGFRLSQTHEDEGGTHYFEARKDIGVATT